MDKWKLFLFIWSSPSLDLEEDRCDGDILAAVDRLHIVSDHVSIYLPLNIYCWHNEWLVFFGHPIPSKLLTTETKPES